MTTCTWAKFYEVYNTTCNHSHGCEEPPEICPFCGDVVTVIRGKCDICSQTLDSSGTCPRCDD